MIHAYAKSCIGFNHINNKKPCQDYTALYRDDERIIITCCDGHGGETYIRSDIGSSFASASIINVFNSIMPAFFHGLTEEEIEHKIKLNILCEWNKMVEENLCYKPIRKNEIVNLSERSKESLKNNPEKAYGTTLTGALLLGRRIIIVGLGDTECLGLSKGEIVKIFDECDEPVANITYSMCQEDAFNHIKVKVLDFKSVDGIMLCTDGLSSPYQSYDNLNNSFIKPMVSKIIETGSFRDVEVFIEKLASELGVGDDVSLSLILKDTISLKYYK